MLDSLPPPSMGCSELDSIMGVLGTLPAAKKEKLTWVSCLTNPWVLGYILGPSFSFTSMLHTGFAHGLCSPVQEPKHRTTHTRSLEPCVSESNETMSLHSPLLPVFRLSAPSLTQYSLLNSVLPPQLSAPILNSVIPSSITHLSHGPVLAIPQCHPQVLWGQPGLPPHQVLSTCISEAKGPV